MPTYFKPLRRKIGFITLVVACVLAIASLRSCDKADDIRLGTLFGRTYTVTSTQGDFECTSWDQYPHKWTSRWHLWRWGKLREDGMVEADRHVSLNTPLPGDVKERGVFNGAENERAEFKWPIRFKSTRLTVFEWIDRNTQLPEVKYTGDGIVVSYWLVTLPMFFLAEHLLRGKPRTPKALALTAN